MAVGNLVKRLQDIMRKDAGINGDAQRIEQMVWMFFLKVYDAAEEDWELEEDNFKSIIPEPLRWHNWAPSKDEEGKEKNNTLTGQLLLDFINDKLFRVLKGMDYGAKSIKDENGKMIDNPDFIEGIKVTRDTPRHKAVVYDIFGEVNQYMKNGVLLRQMIDEIDAVDLLDSEESHQFGDMYETLLKDLQAAGNAGEFYTPRPLTDFTVEHLEPKLGELMGDLAAGTLVVKLRSYHKIQVSLDEYDYLTRNYRPSYPQAADLSLEQVDVITRTLEGDVPERISALAQKVQSVLHVTKRETIDEFFLRRIVRDYQYYALEEV